MKKSLIAMAVAGLFAAPAMADVTISGTVNTGIELGKSGSNTAGTAGLTNNHLGSGYSNINIGSSDDIGNGNKVILNLQWQVNPEMTGGTPFNRNSYLGIAGDWGAFKMGTNENVYERFMYTADVMDGAYGPGGNLNILGTPGAGIIFDAGQSGCGSPVVAAGCAGFYRRTDHTIWYESPNMSGFSFEVDYTLSAFKTATTDPKILSIGGKYQPEGMPFYVDVAYESHDDMFGLNQLTGQVSGTGSKDTGFQVGGGYTFGDLSLHLRFERLEYEVDGANVGEVDSADRDAIWFAAKYNLPSGAVAAEFGSAGDLDCTAIGGTCTNTDSGATMISLGYFHNLSKQSQLQFIYGRMNNDDNAAYVMAGAPGNGNGAANQVFHVGIKHSF